MTRPSKRKLQLSSDAKKRYDPESKKYASLPSKIIDEMQWKKPCIRADSEKQYYRHIHDGSSKSTYYRKLESERLLKAAAEGCKKIAVLFRKMKKQEQLGERIDLTEEVEDRSNLLKADMVEILKQEPDFKAQKGWLQETCTTANHLCIFFPKFHPEFNWIERYWGAVKQITRRDCDYSFKSLQKGVPKALDEVPLSKMRKFARKSYRYMDAYREKDGVALSPKEAEWRVKKYKSHRRIPEIIDLTDEDLQELQILQLPQQQPVQENATDYAFVDDSDRSDTDSDDSDKEED